METKRSQAYDELIDLAGQVAEMFSFNRSIGQIYGCLFMSTGPTPLEDIAVQCHMSKGNASVHLRTLEGWGAVHRSWKSGTRKDYYTANTDLASLANRRLQEGISRRLDHLRTQINRIKKNYGQFSPDATKRLDQLESMLDSAEQGYKVIAKLYQARHLLKKGFLGSLLERAGANDFAQED